VFFEFNAGSVYFVRRTSVTGSAVDNKTEITGVEAFDFTKSQLFWFDLEWLGVGRYRGGIVDPVTNEQIVFHEGVGVNTLAVVYIKSATLPISWEVESQNSATGTGTQLYMDAICCSVDSEGGVQDAGIEMAADNGTTAFTSAGVGTYCLAVLSQVPGDHHIELEPLTGAALCTSASTVFRTAMVWNPTFGGTALSFSSPTNSAVQVAFPGAGTTVSGGTLLQSAYQQTGGNQSLKVQSLSRATVKLGVDALGVPDKVALVIDQISAGNNNYYPTLSWREAY